MDNNNYYQQSYGQQYVQPAAQPVDPNYAETTKSFLTKAIVACALSGFPVASIIAIIMGSNNRQDVLDYLNRGGPHTIKVKVCSCLSRAAKYAGIGYTIFWGVYLIYILFFVLIGVIGIASNL